MPFPWMLPNGSSNRFSLHWTTFTAIVAWFTEVGAFIPGPINEVHNPTDVKPQNIMVSLNVSDATMADYLNKYPATLFELRIQPDLSSDPIITVKSQRSQTLVSTPTLNNLVVKLADYGEGEHLPGHLRTSQTNLTKPFQSRRST